MSAVIDIQRKAMLERSRAIYEQYEQRKATWVMNNPQATPTEYNRAMREIADELGI